MVYQNNWERKSEKKSQPLESKAGYNFVSFDYTPVRRYEDMDALPPHDVLDQRLLSGEIHVTLTANTAICVSNGKKGELRDFVRSADGRYMIPGSSFRGLLRENMQILGLGLIRTGEDFEDKHLLYRSLADAKDAITNKRKKLYRDILGVCSEYARDEDGNKILNQKGKPVTYSVAQAVQSGYLHNDNGVFYIVPTSGKYYSVSAKSRLVDQWRDKNSWYEKVWYCAADGGIADINTEKQDGYLSGTLLRPGYMKNQNRFYLFPDEDSGAERIEIKPEDRLPYELDYKERYGSLEGTQKNMEKAYWALPEKGECKPVFYLRDGARVLFGMSQFMRIPYINTLGKGLPQRHKAQQAQLFLDYPYAVMGFSRNGQSYRSRISVGDLVAKNAVRMTPKTVLLGEPKPSFFPNYTQGGLDYNQSNFVLNGYKQYWLRNESPAETDNAKMGTRMDLLKAGTAFTGTIRYRNLHPDELGLLLWCIRLDNGKQDQEFFHTLGMGKPFGYGRMKPQITALREYDLGELYSDISKGVSGGTDCEERICELIKEYLKWAKEQRNIRVQNIQGIRDFLYMKRKIDPESEDIGTLVVNAKNQKKKTSGEKQPKTLVEFRQVTDPLPTVQEYRSRWGDSEPELVEEEEPQIDAGPPDWNAAAAWAARMNTGNSANVQRGKKKKRW